MNYLLKEMEECRRETVRRLAEIRISLLLAEILSYMIFSPSRDYTAQLHATNRYHVAGEVWSNAFPEIVRVHFVSVLTYCSSLNRLHSITIPQNIYSIH